MDVTSVTISAFQSVPHLDVGCMNNRTIIKLVLAIIGLVLCLGVFPFVGLHYPKIVENEPLHEPVKVLNIQGSTIALENGRTLVLDGIDANNISNQLMQSDYYIDLKDEGDGVYFVYARQDGWVCGTPWAQPIRIPLFEDTVYRNKRRLIAFGELMNNQPSAASNPDSVPHHRDR